jgi:two-component system, OmpR family, sensor histidine kinase BaeS
MKVKLSHKLLASFLCTSLLTVAGMVVLMHVYATRNFTDYVNRVEMEKLSDLLDALKEEYISHQGWGYLQEDPELWWDLLLSKIYRADLDLQFPPPPPPPHPFEVEFDGRERGFRIPGATLHAGEPLPPPTIPPPSPTIPPPSPTIPPPPPTIPPPPPHHDPFSIAPRISLFDDGKILIAGNPSAPEEEILKAIEVDGETAGWLGIKRRTQLSRPLDVEFAYQQTRVFLLTGLVALCVAALISFFLSRHLLRPIRKLIQGTQALSERRFETRVAIESHDELGQLASDFNNMAQALDRYELMRRQWLSDISHELRTPLSILRAEIEAMQDGIREITRESLESLHAEIHHLSKIVNDLHDLSLADSAMLAIKKEPAKPLQILRSTLKVFETRFNDWNITIQDDLESAQELILTGDENRLRQLFSNILENTLNYADCPGTLRIWYHHESRQLTLNFADSGPGVPEESLERLFDRLYRVDGSRNREHGGSGLGLAICKSIVEALGGEISAANAPGGGLWIKIVLPLPSSI